MKLSFSRTLFLFLESHLREITLASRCAMALYERRGSSLSSNTGREDKSVFREKKNGKCAPLL